MSWKKHFKLASTASPLTYAGPNKGGAVDNFGYANWSSQLPEVYVGHPNRVERYAQYENMDMDSEVNTSLDIISEFCTQTNVENGTSFDIHFYDRPDDSEVKILKEELVSWWSLNEFATRVARIFRNTIKYGDQIFIRDPETFKWFWVNPEDVVKIIVDEGSGKEPEQYVLKSINPNFETLTATQVHHSDMAAGQTSTGNSVNQSYIQPNGVNAASGGSRFSQEMSEFAVDAKDIVHVSLTEGMDTSWPFGNSVLERIFKVFKQKELIEDALIIYRVQRAPERRIFYIDVGGMPSHLAMSFVERVKNEIHQRRMPTNNGGSNMMDATYNPLSTNEDYFFPQTAEGRGSKVETLSGGQNLGEVDDLLYFNNKLARGLRIPSSYLPTGPDDGSAAYNDGRLGTALIQEKTFNDYCKKLQRLVVEKFDDEFKIFLSNRGLNIDNSLFELRFNEPQNFAAYRQVEVDSNRIGTYTQLKDDPFFSKRFLLKRYLGLTEEELMENSEMWKEENNVDDSGNVEGSSMRGVGITPGGFNSDAESFDIDDEVGGDEGDLDAGGDELEL